MLATRVLLDQATLDAVCQRLPESASRFAWQQNLDPERRAWLIREHLKGRLPESDLAAQLGSRSDLDQQDREQLLAKARQALASGPQLPDRGAVPARLYPLAASQRAWIGVATRMAADLDPVAIAREIDRIICHVRRSCRSRIDSAHGDSESNYNRAVVRGACANRGFPANARERLQSAMRMCAIGDDEVPTLMMLRVPTARDTSRPDRTTANDIDDPMARYRSAERALQIIGVADDDPLLLEIAHAPAISDAHWLAATSMHTRMIGAARVDAPPTILREWIEDVAYQQHSDLVERIAISTIHADVAFLAIAATKPRRRKRIMRLILRSGALQRPAAFSRADRPTFAGGMQAILDELSLTRAASCQRRIQRQIDAVGESNDECGDSPLTGLLYAPV